MRLDRRALGRCLALLLAAAIQLAASMAHVHPLAHVSETVTAADAVAVVFASASGDAVASASAATPVHDDEDRDHCWLCHLLGSGAIAAPGVVMLSATAPAPGSGVDLGLHGAGLASRAFRARAPPALATSAV